MNASGLAWFKSSYSSGGGGNCVEVAVCPEAVHVRDSKAVRRKPLTLFLDAWSAFTASAADPYRRRPS
ncbi:DUF397 domain-containing protein [Streptomyces sp. SID2888]|uniref:DUF397 domain-containing protein n=1 Tax=Streptomyces sp. SID2888 TaxID=2690256 RepID=UPI00136BE9E9|nr:DUF397 domain-containing protein [Streptomyces sp. SID2888]MYV48135.1 DUF397 domain-containing protein [Streptomyces sp. SID2888]